MGHVDYYPNGGDNQPGCKLELGLTMYTNGIKYLTCNHERYVIEDKELTE